MRKTNFAIFGLTFFAISFGIVAMAALVPSIALYFGVPAKYALRLTWLYMLPYGIFALFWAPLTRIVKVKKLFLITTFGFFLSSLLFSLSSNIHQAFLFRFLTGCFGCSFVPLILITVGKTVPSQQKVKCVGAFFGLSYVSSFVSVALSGFLHWRVIYLIPGLLSLAIFIFILFYLDDFDFRREKFKISYIDTFKDKQAASFFVVVMLGSFLFHSLQQRLGVYLSETYTLNQTVISSIFTVATLGGIAIYFSSGFLSSRLGNIKLARLGFMIMSAFILSLLFIRNYQLMFPAIILWGSGCALTHVGLSSHLTHFPDKILRDVSGLNSALRFSFGGLGAFIGSVIVSLVGFRIHFLLVGISIFTLGYCLNRIIVNK